MSERFYIHCGDDINKQLMDTESDFNIHVEEIGSDEELIRLCNLLNKQQATINKLEQENRQLRHFINKGRRLSVKELIDNTNENELLKKKIKELEKENKELQTELDISKGGELMSERFECVFVEERFVIISTNEFEGRIYDRFDNEFLNLEQILDLLNDYEKNIVILTM